MKTGRYVKVGDDWRCYVHGRDVRVGETVQICKSAGGFDIGTVGRLLERRDTGWLVKLGPRPANTKRAAVPPRVVVAGGQSQIHYVHDLSAGPATASTMGAPAGSAEGRPRWARDW